MEFTCKNCGKVFTGSPSRERKYCCLGCYSQAQRKRITRTCAQCGKRYSTTPSRRITYCSRKCAWKAQEGKPPIQFKEHLDWSAGLTKETDERIARMSEALTIPPASKHALHRQYTIENLTLAEIGVLYGVTSGTVKRWVENYDLLRMRDHLTIDRVRRLRAAGYTYVDIGKMYNCSSSYISKMAVAHGDYVHEPPPEIETLLHLYWVEGMSYVDIAVIFDVDPSTIGHWFNSLDIPARDPDQFGLTRTAQDGHIVRSGLELQVDNWLHRHHLAHIYEPPIPGTNYLADFLVNGRYIEVWGMEGYEPYEYRQRKKRQAYERLRLPLLSIYPHDFPHLDILSLLLVE